MIKWNILITANDGKKFYQNIHVLEVTPKRAHAWVMANYPEVRIRQTIEVTEIENMQEMRNYLPGIVYFSGKAYFETSNEAPPPSE